MSFAVAKPKRNWSKAIVLGVLLVGALLVGTYCVGSSLGRERMHELGVHSDSMDQDGASNLGDMIREVPGKVRSIF